MEKIVTRTRSAVLLLALAFATFCVSLPLDARPMASLRGLTLADALSKLVESGIPVIFTDRLVQPHMRVETEPAGDDPAILLNELLRPHGLRAEPAIGGRFRVVKVPLVVVSGTVESAVDGVPVAQAEINSGEQRLAQTSADGQFRIEFGTGPSSTPWPSTPWTIIAPGFEPRSFTPPAEGGDFRLRLEPVSVRGEDLEIRASRPWILGEGLSSLTLQQQDLLALPQVGDDVLRGLTLLPGASSDDASAQLSIRGGRNDGLLLRLDGIEILEPYHLKDFNNFLSIFSPQIIDRAELITGGFPAPYGDRMSGVLDLTSVRPDWTLRRELSLSPLDARASISAGNEEGRFLISARGGTLELPFRIADEQERPIFADLFAKADKDRDPQRSFRLGGLLSADRLRFAEIADEETEVFRTRYRNAYLWAADHVLVDDTLFFETRLVAVGIERDRIGRQQDPGGDFELRDDRRLLSFGLDQDWNKQWGEKHLLRWGASVRRLESSFDYSRQSQIDDPLGRIRHRDVPTALQRDFDGWQLSAYVSDRIRLSPRLGLELGLRFDRNSVLDDDRVLHPRLSLDYELSSNTRLHGAWGEYSQSQRLYELQVEDGITEFFPTEEAVYSSLGLETTFSGESISFRRRPPTLRAELYRRRVGNPRPRFENLFDPISKVPELEADRVAWFADRSVAQGLELFLGSAMGRYLDGFASYVYAETYDRIDGRQVPRLNDQTHTLRLDLIWHSPWDWDAQMAWHSHTGRPTTALDARLETIDGETAIVPELGPLNGERLPDYHRLDLRISRNWQLTRTEVEFYLMIQNALGRRNLRGYQPQLELGPDGTVDVELEPETWGGVIPTFGLRWRF